jgi:hypothetical protein
MASAGHVLDSVKEEIKVTIDFKNFRSLWDARSTSPEGLLSEPISIAGWSIKLQVKESESTPGSVTLALPCYSDNALPLKVLSETVKCKTIVKSTQEPRWFVPGWVSWEERLRTSRKWVWGQFDTAQNMLAGADSDAGTLSIEIWMVAQRPYKPPGHSSCLPLAVAPGRALWVNPCLVTLKCEGEGEVQVPEQVLCAHSPAFSAALQSGMIEGTTRTITMTDCSRQALEDLCDCLFVGGLPTSKCTDWQRLLNLAVLAHKYEVVRLVDACIFYLSVAISRENVSQLLLKADRYRLLRLLKAALQFTMHHDENLRVVQNSDESEAFSADLVHMLWTYSHVRKSNTSLDARSSLTVQWGDVPNEFPEGTAWEKLSKTDLRRACFERLLGTTGTAAELVVLLSSAPSADSPEDEAKAAKRQRTS